VLMLAGDASCQQYNTDITPVAANRHIGLRQYERTNELYSPMKRHWQVTSTGIGPSKQKNVMQSHTIDIAMLRIENTHTYRVVQKKPHKL